MRRPVTKKHVIEPDSLYNSVKVSKFINCIMWDGKKNGAAAVVYGALDIIKKETGNDPVQVFENAINNVGPFMELKSRRVGGANYQVPREVMPHRRLTLAIRWIIEAARQKKGSSMQKRLADELMAAANGEGTAVTKRENIHKMAESNKAFAYLAW